MTKKFDLKNAENLRNMDDICCSRYGGIVIPGTAISVIFYTISPKLLYFLCVDKVKDHY